VSHPSRVVVGALLIALTTGASGLAMAGSVETKQAEAARIAAQLDDLQTKAFALGADYDKVDARLQKAAAATKVAARRAASLTAQVSHVRAGMKGFAVQSYIHGSPSGVLDMLGGSGAPTEAAQRDQYAALVLGASAQELDHLDALGQDAQHAEELLEARQKRQAALKHSLDVAQRKVERSLAQYRSLQTKVKGELAVAVAAAEARRQAAARAKAAAEARATRRQFEQRSAPASGSSSRAHRPSRTARSGNGVPQGPRPGGRVPSPSPGAAGALAAAMSQLGVPYRFAAASPGVAFDCSGLTSWAWAQAGKYLPHQSGAQAAMLPHVSQADVRPGDLIFYYSPIGHVGMYIGNGQLIHAPRTGDVVKISAVSWSKVVVIGRVT
jgi:cell wall-associated NlpC family hydrolase